MDPPQGRYVDENWYNFDYGHLTYDIPIDVDFTREWAEQTEGEGFQARLTRYDGFPSDIGTCGEVDQDAVDEVIDDRGALVFPGPVNAHTHTCA